MARNFDGIDDRITAPTVNVTGDWTMGAWFKANSAGEGGLGAILWVEPSPNGTVVATVRFDNSGTRIHAHQGHAIIAASAKTVDFAFGVWSLIFCTYTASDARLRFYKGTVSDAVAATTLASQVAGTGAQTTNGGVITAGNRVATDFTFDGAITRPLYAARVLTLSEMEAFRTTYTVPATLLGHWPYTETTGTTANDVSGNNRHGTISGATFVDDPSFSAGSASVTAASSVISSGAKGIASTASIPSSSAVTSTGAKSASQSPSISAASSVTATSQRASSGAASIAAASSVTGAGQKATTQSSSIAAVSEVDVTGAKQASGAASISAASSVTASGTSAIVEIHEGSASITASSSTAAAGTKATQAAVTISAASATTASGSHAGRGSVSISTLAATVAAGTKASSGTATIVAVATVTVLIVPSVPWSEFNGTNRPRSGDEGRVKVSTFEGRMT